MKIVRSVFFLLAMIHRLLIGNPTKHMRIQDTFQADGISYESGDELSETESDLRSSQERLNGNGSMSSPSSEVLRKKRSISSIE